MISQANGCARRSKSGASMASVETGAPDDSARRACAWTFDSKKIPPAAKAESANAEACKGYGRSAKKVYLCTVTCLCGVLLLKD